MGFVLLDLSFRVEKKFRIRLPENWPEQLGVVYDGDDDVTLLQFHDYLLRLCDEQRVIPRAESWETLLDVVEDACGLDRGELTEKSGLRRDITPYG